MRKLCEKNNLMDSLLKSCYITITGKGLVSINFFQGVHYVGFKWKRRENGSQQEFRPHITGRKCPSQQSWRSSYRCTSGSQPHRRTRIPWHCGWSPVTGSPSPLIRPFRSELNGRGKPCKDNSCNSCNPGRSSRRSVISSSIGDRLPVKASAGSLFFYGGN